MKCKHLLATVATAILVGAASAFGTTAYDTAVLGDHPAGYWPLQETAGPTITDAGGTNNGMLQVSTDPQGANGSHAAFVQGDTVTSDGLSYTMGGPGFLFGEPGDKALYFTNLDATCITNAQVKVPYNSAYDTTNFSAEIWLNIPNYPIGYNSNADCNPLGFEANGGSQQGWNILLQTDTSGLAARGRVDAWIAKSNRSGWTSPASGATNRWGGQWVHVVNTYDGTTYVLYVNGIAMQTTVNPTYGRIIEGTHVGDACLMMGSYQLTYNVGAVFGGRQRYRFYHGGMSHVAVYTNALSPTQVLNHYLIGTQGAALPPTIGTQPVGGTNYLGYSRTLSVAAGGTQPLFYQWKKNGLPISDQTNSSLTLNNLVLTNAGNYSVTVSNALNTANSDTVAVGVLSLPTNVYQAAIIGQFPRAYYPLNETNGTLAMDLIRTGDDDGTYVSNDPLMPPLLGQPGASSYLGTAVAFDATVTNGVIINNPNAMGIVGNITLEAWVQLQNASPQHIVTHSSAIDANPSKQANILGIDDFGEYYIGSHQDTRNPNNDVNAFYPVPPEDIGTWVHLVGTYDSATTTWHLYRNGVEVANTSDPTGALSANGGWAIGGRNANSVPQNVQYPSVTGSINNVAIYDYALTPGAVLQHYQIGLTGTVSAGPSISIQPSGPSVKVTWSGGFLQWADSIGGPWSYSDTNTTLSPFTIGVTNAAQFYRATLLPPP